MVDIIVIPFDKFMNSYKSSDQMEMLALDLILKDDSDRSSKFPFVFGVDTMFVSSFRVTKSGFYTGIIFIGSEFQFPSEVTVSVVQMPTVSTEASAILIMNKTCFVLF
jgi:hypothetical protein